MMPATVIEAENISKLYRLGQLGSQTIKDDLARFWARLSGKEDPFKVTAEENERSTAAASQYVWALKDISFSVKEGEIVGIIGRNGAGKSTLLKILSNIVYPTSGEIRMRGRLAALLEVGTGFHPDLTGRENVFLNGTILGMTKTEIKEKFDEIVDFSGVERYIDTPVKRYSSGMSVRLAFAVAAQLDPEILVIDEVLAVGDAEFQKKCLGKMKDVSVSGRTVLFVSHNMNSIASLCKRGIYLKNGRIKDEGEIHSVINSYLSDGSMFSSVRNWTLDSAPGDDYTKLTEVRLINDKEMHENYIMLGNGKYGIEITYQVFKPIKKPVPQVHFFTSRQDNIFISYGHIRESEYYRDNILSPGTYKSLIWLPESIFNTGYYYIGVGMANMEKMHLHFWEPETITFEVLEDIEKRKILYKGSIGGLLRPELKWDTERIRP